ncbi:hypothetical protein UA75_23555 [Actinoalloteichus sp. GBA129-24]|uniref:Uncharacterized protein n=1 Tax=Actinoalloteichus fjordicus TaxID=1612552 RepID=A0AAC9PU09_9PSEU|nr:hypothetical protein UA74_23045 [Actinoalloteichus fjordicus]APU22693.1 hypothetical protein UA75_23555 [Actinoalloteichus sp. GBA129-24]
MIDGERGGFLRKHEGRLTDCVDALRELPDPDRPGAPRLLRSRLWLPR